MGGFEMQIAGAELISLADLKDSATVGLMLTATLIVLNLPRISAWVADRWKACRVNRDDPE